MATRKDIIPVGMEMIVERFHYAPGVLVDDTLYIAGQVGRNDKLEVVVGAEAQFEPTSRVFLEKPRVGRAGLPLGSRVRSGAKANPCFGAVPRRTFDIGFPAHELCEVFDNR